MTQPRSALITGVGGQDGWYLSRALIADGYHVVGTAHIRPADPPAGVEILIADITDAAAVQDVVNHAGADEVYNLAAVSSVAQSWDDPERAVAVNAVGLLHVLRAVQAHDGRTGGQTRIVQASSAEIFGHAEPPQDEDTPLAPVTPYGAAKAMAQHLVAVYRAAGMWVASGVLFNHESERRPAGFVTRKIAHGVAQIAHGSSEPLVLGNMAARRDWGHAVDYAGALRLIAAHDVPDDFVVASGESHTVADFVRTAFAHVGISDWESYVRSDARLVRGVDPSRHRGNAKKARAQLGWMPTVTFGQLVATMVDAELAR